MKIARILVVVSLLAFVACKETDKKENSSSNQNSAATLKANLDSISSGSAPANNGGYQQTQQNGMNIQAMPQRTLLYVGPDSTLVRCAAMVYVTGANTVHVVFNNSCRWPLGYQIPVVYRCREDNTCGATSGVASGAGSPSPYQVGSFSPQPELMQTYFELAIGPGTMSVRVIRAEVSTGAKHIDTEFPFVVQP